MPLRGAVRSAPLREIAETVSRALAYLTYRLIWPYCLPLMAERCMIPRYEIEWAHEAHIRCAERNGANRIRSDLHDRLVARLLGSSLLDERDHNPRNRSGNNGAISIQDWLATSGVTQPLAQRWGRSGSSVSKFSVVKTVHGNLLELRMRHHDYEHGLPGGVTRPSEPGPTAVPNEAAPHQTDADAASTRGPSSSVPIIHGRNRLERS